MNTGLYHKAKGWLASGGETPLFLFLLQRVAEIKDTNKYSIDKNKKCDIIKV